MQETPARSEAEYRQDARNLALSRLSVREYAARELLGYLKRKKIPAEIASETVQRLVEEKLLDDRRYARAVTRSQAVRDKGPSYILAKLKQKGVKIELDEVRLESGWSSHHRKTTTRVLVGKDISDKLRLRYSRSIDEIDDQTLSFEYQLSDIAALEGNWLSASKVSIGDLGLDLRLRWEFR